MAVVRLDELIGLGYVRNFHVLPVEVQFLAGTQRDITHQDKFSKWSGVVEVCARIAFAPAGIEPVTVVPLNAGQALGWLSVGSHLGFWNYARGSRPATAQDGTFSPYE